MNDNLLGKYTLLTPKIVPAVYNNALEYMEQLNILDAKLTEVINAFNDLQYTTLEDANKYTDEKVSELKIYVDSQFNEFRVDIDNRFIQLEQQLKEEISNAVADFRVQIEELLTEVNSLVDSVKTKLDQLEISINALFDMLSRVKLEMRFEMMAEVRKIKQYVDDAIVAKMGRGILVYNVVQKKYTDLDTALNDLYQITYRIFALTVDEYRSLNLTVDSYKEMKITVTEYLYHGKLLFFKELYFPTYDKDFAAVYAYIDGEVKKIDGKFYMYSPFDGTLTLMQKVINDLADLHKDGINVDQYKSANLTVDQYKEKNIGAHDYAWNGYYLIFTDAVPKETLEEMVRELQKTVAGLSARLESEIDGLNDTLTTVDNGLRTQIQGITSGLNSIHITY